MVGKSPFVSKTLVFNALALAVALALQFGFGDFEPAPEVADIAVGIAAVINVLLPILTPVVNMGLRLVTKEPIRFGQ
jgi:hypothetical protein